jgi:hypothetical protein
MTDPKEEQQQDREELDLDAETVRDLEPTDSDADAVRGGLADQCACSVTEPETSRHACRPT